MGFLAKLTTDWEVQGDDKKAGILTLVEMATKVFGGGWDDINPDKIFADWSAVYNEDCEIRPIDKFRVGQVEYYRNSLKGTFEDWQKQRTQSSAAIKLGEDLAAAKYIQNAFKNLADPSKGDSILSSRGDKFKRATSSLLHVVAAELWRQERTFRNHEEKKQELSTTILKLRTVLACDPAFAVAELPESLRMLPQEDPASYLSSKYQNFDLHAATRESLVNITKVLRDLHNPKLEKQREANLKLLSASVKEAENKIIGDDRIMLPLVAEATREALGLPRGKRDPKQGDVGSKEMTKAEKTALEKDEEKRRK